MNSMLSPLATALNHLLALNKEKLSYEENKKKKSTAGHMIAWKLLKLRLRLSKMWNYERKNCAKLT